MLRKIFKYIFLTLCFILSLTIITLYLTDHQYLIKAVRVVYLTGHKSAFLEDYKYFDNRQITPKNSKPWTLAKEYNQQQSSPILDSIHKKFNSVAYLIIQNDSIRYEKYYQGYSDTSLSNAFSMTKSIVSACLGKAIELGYVQSINDKVNKYLPELKGAYAKDLSIRDLVTMRSGLQWDESYSSPLSITTKAYFYDDLSKAILDLPISSQPNQSFKYQSGDTQLLAMVLSKALPMPLSDFLTEYIWQPIEAESTALWQYNKADQIEKSYCCLASTARDFARFGKLYLQHGKWNNKQIIDSNYVVHSLQPAAENSPNYGYGWWLTDYEGKEVYNMNGHLGQFVMVIPADNLIIVRLGHQNDGKKISDKTAVFYQYIQEAYRILSLH